MTQIKVLVFALSFFGMPFSGYAAFGIEVISQCDGCRHAGTHHGV